MRRRFIVLAGVLMGIASPLASADELKNAATKVTECRSIAEDSARLACLDSAALALSAVLESEAVAAKSEDLVPAPAPASETPKAPEPPKWAQAPKSKEAPKPEKSVEPDKLEEPKWRRAPEPKKTPEPTATKKRPPLWARVLRPDDGSDDDLYPVTVVKITRNGAGRVFFYTEGGQVWRQTQVKEVTPPKSLPAGAVIQKSATGNPRFSFDDVPNRSYRVRRVE